MVGHPCFPINSTATAHTHPKHAIRWDYIDYIHHNQVVNPLPLQGVNGVLGSSNGSSTAFQLVVNLNFKEIAFTR